MYRQNIEKLYSAYRKEQDRWYNIPQTLALDDFHAYPICDKAGNEVGMLCTIGNYIECVYVIPQYRKKGYATTAVQKWYRECADQHAPVVFNVMATNLTAMRFWNSAFDLEIIESDGYSTAFRIVGAKPVREHKPANRSLPAITPPCKDCASRTHSCHAQCQDYRDYLAELEQYKAHCKSDADFRQYTKVRNNKFAAYRTRRNLPIY